MSLTSFLHDYQAAIRNPVADSTWGPMLRAVRVAWARLRHGIGPRLYSLFGFDQVPIRQWADWLVDEPLKLRQRACSTPEVRAWLDNKLLFHRLCREHGIGTVPIWGRIGRESQLRDPQVLNLESPSQLADLLQKSRWGLFVKQLDGSHGDGAFAVLPIAGNHQVGEFLGAIRPLAHLLAHCKGSSGLNTDWLVQPIVRNHAAMAPLVFGGLSTVRVVTQRQGEAFVCVAATLKMPMEGNVVDNFLQGRAGNLAAAVNVESGRLYPAKVSLRRDWPVIATLTHHPCSGLLFNGFQLPLWPQAVQAACRAHQALPSLPAVGWDVALCEDGVLIVEGNPTFDVDLLQFTHGRGLRRLFAGSYGLNG